MRFVVACLCVSAGCAPPPAASTEPATPVVDARTHEAEAGWQSVPEDDTPPEIAVLGPAPPPSEPVTPPADHGQCIRGRMCQLEGFCSVGDDGQCIAASSDDCRPSDACLGGRCTAQGGVCIAANDEDCRSSWACKGYGLCHHDGAGSCAAKNDHDCRASTRCARLGECRLDQGACVR